MKGTNAELTFENLDFNNYYPVSARAYDGYQGFNFIDMGLLTQSAVEWLGYGDWTGYTAAIGNSTTCAFTYGNAFGGNGSGGLGEMRSADKHETFNLKSGTFASAWDSVQPTYFEALNSRGQVTATVEVNLGQTATTINFGSYGSEFKHISGLKIVSEPGQAGKYGFAGYQIAMDNLYVHWNGSIPGEHQHHRAPGHAIAAPLATVQHDQWSNHSAATDSGHTLAPDHGYHSVITSLSDVFGHTGGGGLTADFSLPQLEHHLGL